MFAAAVHVVNTVLHVCSCSHRVPRLNVFAGLFALCCARCVWLLVLSLALVCVHPNYYRTPGLQHRVRVVGVLFAVRGVYGRVRGVFREAFPARGHRGARGSYRRVVRGETLHYDHVLSARRRTIIL